MQHRTCPHRPPGPPASSSRLRKSAAKPIMAVWLLCQHITTHASTVAFLAARGLVRRGAPADGCRKPGNATMPHLLLERATRLRPRLIARTLQQFDEQRMWRPGSLVLSSYRQLLQGEPRATEARGFLQPQAAAWIPRVAVDPAIPSSKSSSAWTQVFRRAAKQLHTVQWPPPSDAYRHAPGG